jgi:hypothetical protein
MTAIPVDEGAGGCSFNVAPYGSRWQNSGKTMFISAQQLRTTETPAHGYTWCKVSPGKTLQCPRQKLAYLTSKLTLEFMSYYMTRNSNTVICEVALSFGPLIRVLLHGTH